MRMDAVVLGTVKKRGGQALSSLTGIGGAQVFVSVDRLSRIRRVSLTLFGPVSIGFRLRGCFAGRRRGEAGYRLRIIRPIMPMPIPSRI